MQQIIGQQHLIPAIDKIYTIFNTSEARIRPHFILTGESGSGKTLLISTLAAKYKFGFVDINAAQLTKEGTSGNSLSKALTPLMQMGGKRCIIFVDEWDKLFISGNNNDSLAHETTTGVQNEFLKVLESNVASVYADYGKYANVKVDNCLFVFAGAFNNEPDISLDRLRTLGVKTEFLGRVGLVYSTRRLSLEEMYEVVDTNELLSIYANLYSNVDVETVKLDLKIYIRDNYDKNTLGARLVNTLVHQYFIKGGKLGEEVLKEMTFQNKLTL